MKCGSCQKVTVMVSIPSKKGKNHTVCVIFFLSPDFGHEGFRPAGPVVPPTFHHLKMKHRFLAKTRMHMYPSIYSTAYFPSKVCHARATKAWALKKHLQPYGPLNSDSLIWLFLFVIIQSERHWAIPDITKILTKTRFPVTKTVNWLVTSRLTLCDL